MKTKLLLAASLATATPAMASDMPGDAPPAIQPSAPLALDWQLTATSDYRNRGISVTRFRAALQQEVTLRHVDTGLYATGWASTIARNGTNNWEVDVVAGWAGSIGGLDVDAGAVFYAFPGAGPVNYAEANLELTRSLGGPEVGLLVSYAPSQPGLGHRDNLYLRTSASLPLRRPPITFSGTLGVEKGAFGDWKRDWTLGASLSAAGFDWLATYVDTARSGHDPLGKPGLVLAISRGF